MVAVPGYAVACHGVPVVGPVPVFGEGPAGITEALIITDVGAVLVMAAIAGEIVIQLSLAAIAIPVMGMGMVVVVEREIAIVDFAVPIPVVSAGISEG